jgi:hypothetical protein
MVFSFLVSVLAAGGKEDRLGDLWPLHTPEENADF